MIAWLVKRWNRRYGIVIYIKTEKYLIEINNITKKLNENEIPVNFLVTLHGWYLNQLLILAEKK